MIIKPLTNAFLRKRLIKRYQGIEEIMNGIQKKAKRLGNNLVLKTIPCILMLFVFVAEINAAQPTIAGYNGEIQNGNSITILGNNFVNDNSTDWINDESGAGLENDTDFAASKFNDDGWLQEDSGSSIQTDYVTDTVLMGKQSACLYDSINCPSGSTSCGENRLLTYVMPASKDLYISGYVRYDGHWPDHYLKMLITNGGNQWYFQPQMRGGNNPTQALLKQGVNIKYVDLPGPLTMKNWHYWEVHWKTGSPNRYEAWWNGTKIADWQVGSGQSIDWFEWGIPNYSGSGPYIEAWFDRVVYSTSRIYQACSIEVSNSSDYNSGTKKWQHPEYLSDGTVTFKLNLTDLGTGPFYVWVTNNGQKRSDPFGPLSLANQNDDVAPTVAIIKPPNDATVSGDLVIEASAADNVGVAGVRFLCNDGNCLDLVDTTNTFSVTLDTATLPDGTYTLTAIATDTNGNQTESSPITVTFANSLSPPDPPADILVEETFENTSFGSRGWYDNTNLVLSSTEHAPGSSKSVEFHFAAGATIPDSGAATRILFTETDQIYVKYYVKYSANWQGSNKTYHPHEFMVLTNIDGKWSNLAYTHLTTYIEQNEGEPLLGIQDGQNIDTSRIGDNLTGITENRALAGCNGDSDGTGDGTCYSVGGGKYWNGKLWRAGQVYFQDAAGPYYKNDWHLVEVFIKLNSIVGGKGVADGIVRYWYDGTLIIDHSSAMLRAGLHPNMKFIQFVIAPWIGDGSPVDQTFWVDDLTIATAPPDSSQAGTPPAPPTGLRVVGY
ncbi:hypothetical protein D1AOALGA4SA_3122 [Olavius algarvensis Delta 1 endosymbiont]|nr:hypothetical protein D1AOALGA4SA_3122 [Olavius algarvensis Delta 1 endosymbiont]